MSNFQHWLGREFNNKIVDQEQIDLWNKYLVIEPDTDVFDYLDDLILDIINKPENPDLSCNEVNCCGGRYGGKTFNICAKIVAKLIAISIKYDFKIAIYGFRRYGADIQELRKNIDYALNDINLIKKENVNSKGHYTFVNGQNIPTYKFINGSFIQLKGVYKAGSNEIALKGLAEAKDCSVAISICEEANEISNKEYQAIDTAIRGAKRYLKIKLSNPDNIYQDFIKYCNDRVKFNEFILDKEGQQFNVIQENDRIKVFHYTNYKINAHMTKDQVLNMMELKALDPIKHKIWGIGMPGNLESSIFGNYLEKLEFNNIKEFNPIAFTGGVDLGQADTPTGHPTSALLIGFDNQDRIKPLDQLFHNNYLMPHKDPNELAEAIIQFYIEASKKYNLLIKKGLNVFIDGGGGGKTMITLLNNIKNEKIQNGYNLNWLNLIEIDKEVWFIKDRIDATIILITKSKLMIDKKLTPYLLEQMSLMEWKAPRNTQDNYVLKALDKNDDSWDSLCYAIMPRLIDVLENKNNNLFISKNTAKRYKKSEWDLEKREW